MTPEDAFLRAAPHYIPVPMRNAIRFIFAQRAVTITELAAHMNISRTTATYWIEKMRRVGIVCIVDKRKDPGRSGASCVYALGDTDTIPPPKSSTLRVREHRERKRLLIEVAWRL